jgi:hypothetical protein
LKRPKGRLRTHQMAPISQCGIPRRHLHSNLRAMQELHDVMPTGLSSRSCTLARADHIPGLKCLNLNAGKRVCFHGMAKHSPRGPGARKRTGTAHQPATWQRLPKVQLISWSACPRTRLSSVRTLGFELCTRKRVSERQDLGAKSHHRSPLDEPSPPC